MKLGLINSAWVQAGKGTAWGLQQTKAIGFDAVDIFIDPCSASADEQQLVKDECDRLGLPIVSLACVALGLSDFNESVRRFHIDRAKRYLDLCRGYAAENVLIVLGEYIWDRQVIPPAEQWQLAVDSCRELGAHAESLGVRIALELEPFTLSMLNNVDQMVRFIDEVDSGAVRANIDVSHLVLANVPATDLRKLDGRAIHVHISDCDGVRHGDLPPGRGVVPFGPYLEEIRWLGIDGTVSIELEYSPEPDRIKEWVAEAYAETDKLMRAAGLRG